MTPIIHNHHEAPYKYEGYAEMMDIENVKLKFPKVGLK